MSNIHSPTDDARIVAALHRSLELGETGIGVAAYYRGRLVVDAIAGTVAKTSTEPVTKKTLFPIFSVTKGITALAVHIQADRRLLDVNDPISKYWPEFGINGKENITIEQALSHRAGIPQMPPGVTPQLMADWEWMVKHVAESKPIFPPGQANAYHVLVWGWILGEVVRRTDPAHRQFDIFIHQEICKPLGVTDFYLGVPSTELARVATLSGGNSFAMVDEHGISPVAVFPGSDVHNISVVQQCVDPGAGAIANASSVARIFALIAEGGELNGVRLLSKERIACLTRPRAGAHDPDKVLPIPVWFGAAGYWLGGEPNASDPLVGDHRDIIYSPGAGGSIAWADLRDRIAVAICHNNMDSVAVLEPERTFAPIVRAVREIIADAGPYV
ncbi:beta-lactamase/transpeptidase-like protein [Zopfia rhizophila CBS 207.26]|uniref:Beta-lactamase/transpeptidase-like protein n=1 Tax=Zopfia rhizophila CBS 207.26 TaxID=1314779 RepID=A0A6A6DM01_9PEZI|nr:beta-lactamase/transpeptidase-like protein [Zopfia rhizophila CBS 207.26]